MSRPLVSVIIPTFNRLAYLKEALDSVAAQTFRDFEVIVVDDGSTEPIAEHAARHSTRPTIIRQSNQGPAAARNRGLAAAAGELVAFLDSDDLWCPEKLERFVGLLRGSNGASIFYGPMQPIAADGRMVDGRTKPCHAGWITEPLFCSSFIHVPTVVCRRALLLAEGGFNPDLPVCEDYELWLRLSVRQAFGLVEEPLALRRLHPDRLSKQCMSRNLAVKARMLLHFYDSNLANGHLRREVAEARLAHVCHAAARAALRGGAFREAADLSRTSRRYGGSALINGPLALVAGALSPFSRNGNGHGEGS